MEHENKLTEEYLSIALRLAEISISDKMIPRLKQVIELVIEKGGEATLWDICELRKNWQ